MTKESIKLKIVISEIAPEDEIWFVDVEAEKVVGKITGIGNEIRVVE